jgi:fumarate reductase flavoprotein subunit
MIASLVTPYAAPFRRFRWRRIHGANTYLIQQFYSPNSNQRDDEAAAATTARIPAGGAGHHPQNGPPVRGRCLYHRLPLLAGRDGSAGIRFDDTMYLLEKLAARGRIICTSPCATLRPSIVDTTDPTPLIEKYCAMRSETWPGAGDGRGRRGERG